MTEFNRGKYPRNTLNAGDVVEVSKSTGLSEVRWTVIDPGWKDGEVTISTQHTINIDEVDEIVATELRSGWDS